MNGLSRTGASGRVAFHPSNGSAYPLQARAFWLGILWSLPVAVLFGSWLIGFVLFILFCCMGLLWRKDAVPVLVFCIAYQWIFVANGLVFIEIYDRLPAYLPTGDLTEAALYGVLGLFAVSLGVRWAFDHVHAVDRPSHRYDVRKLFWSVIVLFAVNWVIEIAPRQLLFNAAEILSNVMKVRYLFLFALFYVVINERRGYRYAIIGLAYVMLPELLSGFSRFKELLFVIGIVTVGQWKPWSHSRSDQAMNRRVKLVVLFLGIVLVAAGLVWSGGLKHAWRQALWSGEIAGDPTQKLSRFGEFFWPSWEDLDVSEAFEMLSSRTSSSLAYFSLVVERVPRSLSHEGGEMSMRAVRHILMPRVLFPDKPSLGSDSWIVRKYAGLEVAGEESGTSVGLSYLAEFYIDFGFPVMLLGAWIIGAFVGVLHQLLRRIAPSYPLFVGSIAALFLQNFTAFEATLPKMVGGMLQLFIFIFLFLLVFGRYFDHYFTIRGKTIAVHRSQGTTADRDIVRG